MAPVEQQEPTVQAAAAAKCEVKTVQARPGRISWARLLKRVFDIDMQCCLLERPVIMKIPTHLGLDPQPPPRGGRASWCRTEAA